MNVYVTSWHTIFIHQGGKKCNNFNLFNYWDIAQSAMCLWMMCIFIPLGHSEPDRRGAAAGPDQLLPQLHGAHQAAKEKVRLWPASQDSQATSYLNPWVTTHTDTPLTCIPGIPAISLCMGSDPLEQENTWTCDLCVGIKLKHNCGALSAYLVLCQNKRFHPPSLFNK